MIPVCGVRVTMEIQSRRHWNLPILCGLRPEYQTISEVGEQRLGPAGLPVEHGLSVALGHR